MRSPRRACRKTCEQYGRIGGTAAGRPDTARCALRGYGVAVEALQFSVEVHGKDTFLRGKLQGVGQSVVPLAEELLPVVAAAIRTVGGCRLKTVFQVIAERAQQHFIGLRMEPPDAVVLVLFLNHPHLVPSSSLTRIRRC